MLISLIQFSSRRDGSAFSGLLLADGLAAAGMRVHVIFGADGPMVTTYAEHGHGVEVVPHKNWLRGGGVLRTLRNALRERRIVDTLAKRITASGGDVVYVNTAASYAGALAAAKLGLPCVWHLRELFADVGGELACPWVLRPWVRREIRRLGTRLVANSRAVAENLLGNTDAAVILPNAVEERFFIGEVAALRAQARVPFGLGAADRVIGIPGTLRPMKGHRFALEALAPVLGDDANMKILISGGVGGDFASDLTAWAATLPTSGKIHFVGEQSDMLPFYAACDVVCVPSSSEAFGRTVIEAMAVGVPLVATRVGGIPEIIDDLQTGLLVEFGDTEALRQAVQRLLRDEPFAQTLALHARDKALREYHARIYQERVARIIRDML